MNPAPSPSSYERWQAFSAACVRGFHSYASWLVSISWRRFIVLAVLLIAAANILQSLPPFTWRITEQFEGVPSDERLESQQKKIDRAARKIEEKLNRQQQQQQQQQQHKSPGRADDGVHFDVSIDKNGIRVQPRAASASAPAAGVSSPEGEGGVSIDLPNFKLKLPPGHSPQAGLSTEDQEALMAEIREQMEQAAAEKEELRAELEQVRADTQQALQDAASERHSRVRIVHWGDFLQDLAVLFVLCSALIKATYKGRIQAEFKAAKAAETAEAESLKRQVVEARMAAMQAQVEPHFLFNTLASIDHLIETDPPRASQMQRNLIALLRASMPTMREANASGVRELGREMAVIRPYLEILKVRMEERLQTEIDVPEGLLSAEFPPLMIQGLVENAIKHGLEPKAEGGTLKVRAEVQHGKLAVTVADTGLGFGRAATAGTGVGLANIRERLSLLYGANASLTIAENQPSGTIVTISVPYRSRGAEA